MNRRGRPYANQGVPRANTPPRRGGAILHLIHLPDEHSHGAAGDFAGLQLAVTAASALPGRHLIVAMNSAERLDRLCTARLGKSIEFGCIAPPLGRVASAIRPVKSIIDGWNPGAVVIWHPTLSPIGAALMQDGVLVIQGWTAPMGAPASSSARGGLGDEMNPDMSSGMTTPSTPTSAMARLLAREQLGIPAEDERPLVTLLPNVPEIADAWWFSVTMGLLESARLSFIGAIPAPARQRSRGRRYRHASGLITPAIEWDQPLKLMLDASDIIVSVGRDSDRDLELEETAVLASGASTLDRVVMCQALASAVPTIVTPAHAAVVPAGLRGMLVADGTRASKVAARIHGLLDRPGSLDQVRRVLSGSVISCPEAEIVNWVRDRLALRDLHAHAQALAGAS